MYAKIAAVYIHAFCRETFVKDPDSMAASMANAEMIDVFDHRGYGSHKDIPTNKLNKDLDQSKGGGVYGFWLMGDGSYLLLTCGGRLAYWSGKKEDKAKFSVKRKEMVP